MLSGFYDMWCFQTNRALKFSILLMKVPLAVLFFCSVPPVCLIQSVWLVLILMMIL